MAIVVGVQQQALLQSRASFRPCFQAGNTTTSICSESSSPSSCPILQPSAATSSSSSSSSSRTTGLWASWTPQELSNSRVGAMVQRSSRKGRQLGRRQGSLLGCRASFGGGGGALSPELKSALDNFVRSNKVVLFMKGNRNFPQCGFSNTCIQILNQCSVPYETVNILEDDSLRQGVKEYSNWPTYPQLYIDGEFFGGCDITLEAFKSGELKEALDKAMVS